VEQAAADVQDGGDGWGGLQGEAMKRIAIDADLLEASRKYVEAQLAVMEQHSSALELSPEKLDELVYKCAVYPQRIRNQVKKNERQKR
jgi:hypothetical protein